MDNFNLNKYFKNQYLTEGDITPSDISPYKLEKHSDIKIFADALSKALGFDVEQSLGSGSYNGRGGYYIKMPRREIRYWGDDSIKAVKSAFNEANKLSKEYNFEYEGVTDYEEDPGERSWPASIGLFIQEKSLNEDKYLSNKDSYIKITEPSFRKDKNNPNFLSAYIKYDTGPGVGIALGKETMAGQIRRLSSAEALRQMEIIGRKLNDSYDLEDLDINDLENGVVELFAVSDDFIEMDPKSELINSLLNEIKLNEIHPKSKELADDYSMGELKNRLSQLYRDMEQEAEPEGGPISDQYADEITFHEDAIRLKKGPIKKDVPYDVAIGKMTQDEYDTVVSKNKFTKSSQFDRMNEGEWTYEFGELDESSSSEEKRIALRAIKSIAKYRGVSEDEAKRDLIRAAKELGGLKEAIIDLKETIKLGKTLNEELCAKGKAYRKKRMAAGEKSSAYLSGRAVRVCKGDMKG